MLRNVFQKAWGTLSAYITSDAWILLREIRMVWSSPCIVKTLNLPMHNIVIESNYVPQNASIMKTTGGWLALVRTVNYRVTRIFHRWSAPGGPREIRSETWLVRYDNSLQPRSRTLIKDIDPDTVPIKAHNGFDDPRVFEWKGQVWGLWSASHVASTDWSDVSSTMMLARVHDCAMHDAVALPSPYGHKREKNWMPIVIGESLFFIYSLASMEVYEFIDNTLVLKNKYAIPDLRLKGFSGSSQLIPWGDGWLGTAHYAARIIRRATSQLANFHYVHCFVLIGKGFKIDGVSRTFFLEHKGTEFSAGLAIDGERILLSGAINECESRIYEMTRQQVLDLFA